MMQVSAWEDSMKIENGKLMIRSAEIRDAEQLTAWWNDGKVMEHAGFPHGLGTSEDEVKKLIENGDKDGKHRLVIEIDGKPSGEMCWSKVGESPKTAEIGIKICDLPHQEKGFGTSLLKMLIGYLFEEEGFEAVCLDTMIENKRAQHVYEKLGFVKLRENKDCWTDQLGNLRTSVDYELKRENWEA